jgi:hypothetical protein
MMRAYERAAERVLVGQTKAKRIARFIDGHLRTGHQSLHKTRQSRMWRLFWRLKNIRQEG